MKKLTNKLSNLRLLGLVLCGLVLSGCSQEPEVLTDIETISRDDILYSQETNQPFTGIIESFYDNGRLRGREHYFQGVREGLKEIFHANGQLGIRAEYSGGERQGRGEYFHESGESVNFEATALSITYAGGLDAVFGAERRENGIWYHSDTDVPFTGWRTGIVEGDRDSGFVWFTQELYQYQNGKLDGYGVVYLPNGTLIRESAFREGERHGTQFQMWPNGNMRWTYQFNNGVQVGESFTYEEDGTTKSITGYDENGNMISAAIRGEDGNLIQLFP